MLMVFPCTKTLIGMGIRTPALFLFIYIYLLLHQSCDSHAQCGPAESRSRQLPLQPRLIRLCYSLQASRAIAIHTV